MGYALREVFPDAVFLTSRDGDLRRPETVEGLFETHKPQAVIHLAAKVFGVKANALKNADLFAENVLINTNVLATARETGVQKLVSVLSSCAFESYPDRPSTEEDLHVGLPYGGNLGYGYSKRALDIQTRLLWEQYGCRYTTIAPVTMYGPNDNWDLEDGHVIGSLIHRCFLAKQAGKPLEVWGSGRAVRQFVFSYDVARLLAGVLKKIESPRTMIVAADNGISVKDLAAHIARAMEFEGPVVFNSGQPEGQLVKTVQSKTFAKLFPEFAFTPLEQGLRRTAAWFLRSRHAG